MTKQRLARDLFRLSVELCPNGMVIHARDGTIVLVNAALETIFGYDHGTLRGHSIDALLPGRHCAGKGPLLNLAGIRKDGSDFPAEVHFSPTWFRGQELTLGVILDVSERRQSERLKDEFVSTVSHELRTPLTSISGSLGLIAGGAAGTIPEPAMRLIKIAHKNSDRLVRLINDILDIEKIESGKIVFDLKRVELRGLIEQAIEANRGYAETFEVNVVLDPAAEAVFVRADPDRLVQVITNLLSNACKFSSRRGEVHVAIELERETVRIAVRDHGPGIPQDFRARIFQKFAQADAAEGRLKGGTGLGLSIVKQIVTLLGGSVGFRDGEGGGTVFHVDLPRWELAEGSAAATPASILICDDDAPVADTIAERLERADFSCDIALTAGDSLAKAQARAYQAILVDLGLPDRDGISLIQDLRSNPRHQNTPIVVISADAARGRSDLRSSSLDVLDWLNKPFDSGHLVEVLQRPLARNGGKRPSILHIDDDTSVREVVAQAVGEDWDVASVATIDEARRALVERRFDLAVVDLLLSQASGLDLLPELRDRDGNAIPVILYSARAANGANAAQVQAALNKSHRPIDHLIATLRKHVTSGPAFHPREVA